MYSSRRSDTHAACSMPRVSGMDFRVPFLYASNGTLIWHLDARPDKLVSRQVSDFHTPEALAGFFSSDASSARTYLLDTPPEQITGLRPYQRDSILAVEQAILGGRRDMMVAMATGTGKTYLTVAQIYRLLESGLARRILFLVDRKALAAQAVREFNSFNTPKGNKFTQEYEVYSQRFQKEDFGDDAPFDPKVLPNEYLTAPKAEPNFRLRLDHPAHGAESIRRRRQLRAISGRRRHRGRCRPSRHSHSRIRSDHRG